MIKKFRIITLGLLLVLIALAGVIFLSFSKNAKLPSTNIEQSKQQAATFIVDFGNEEKLNAAYKWEGTKTVFDALVAIAQQEDIKIETQQYDFGVFVKNINGRENTAEKAWIYFVNGKAGQVAADKYELSPNDVVEWKYIIPSENY